MKKLLFIGAALFIVILIFGPKKKEAVTTQEDRPIEKVLTPEEIKANKIAEEKGKLEFRKSYETILRNNYLDNNLDIKVNVKGSNKDILELKYALFSDVWTRKMETSGNFTEWQKMGFKKIIVTDGYDYNMVVTWND